MSELVTIPISFFEITIDYEHPVFKVWIDRGAIVQGMFDALKAWCPSIDDTELRMTGKPSEQGVAIKLPLKRASFFSGQCRADFRVTIPTGDRRKKQ